MASMFKPEALSTWAESRLAQEVPGIPMLSFRFAVHRAKNGSMAGPRQPAAETAAELSSLAVAARRLEIEIRRLGDAASWEFEPDPFGGSPIVPLTFVEDCARIAAEAERAANAMQLRANPGAPPTAFTELVCHLAFLFGQFGLPVCAGPKGAFYQVINIIWQEINGRDLHVTPDRVRKCLARHRT